MKKTEKTLQQVYQDYQDSLVKEAYRAAKNQVGKIIWNSAVLGTYIKASHGKIGS